MKKMTKTREKRSKSRLGLRIMGSRMLGLNKKGGITMKKMTKQEKNEVKAGWVCVLWGAVCWG